MVVHVFSQQITAKKFFDRVGVDPESFDDDKPIAQKGYQKENRSGPIKNAAPPLGLGDTIVILGTGDLAKALITRLVRRGYKVVVASRDPEKNRARIELLNGEVESYEDALDQSDVVFAAVPFEAYTGLPADLLEGKIVIDVSNRPPNYHKSDKSLAEQLQEELPDSKVVKAFNTISAYGMQNNLFQGSTEVPVCSDDEDAKSTVMTLVRNMGLTPVDGGNLSNALEIEGISMSFFSEWRLAAILTLSIFIFAALIILFREQLCPNIQRQTTIIVNATKGPVNQTNPWDWDRFNNILLENIFLSHGLTAITLLSICYLPGVIASFIQLVRGTKYSEFPDWIDQWLRSRKYIGLLALYCASMHALMSIYVEMEDTPLSTTWQTFSFLAIGCFAIGLMIILGITSIPSVSESLTWMEFSFVQRYLGWWTLLLVLLHFIFARWDDLISNGQQCVVIPDEGQIFIILPMVVIFLKLILILPCIDIYLQKIRRGYERK